MNSAQRVVKGEQSESAQHSAAAVINDWIRKQLQVTFFNAVIDDLMWKSDRLRYRRARTWITGGATRRRICYVYQQSAINEHAVVINSQKQCGESQLRCFMVTIISLSLMNVHTTVSTTVCKALVSVALVQLCMCHLSCHRQFTRLGTRAAICPTSMGCTEGRFAQFWHAWLHLMLHKCLETLHKQWDLH